MLRDRAAEGYLSLHLANVAEPADAQDLGSCPARGPGSTPGVRIAISSRWSYAEQSVTEHRVRRGNVPRRLVPVDLKGIDLLGGAGLLPFIPLAVHSVPLDAVLRALARFFV